MFKRPKNVSGQLILELGWKINYRKLNSQWAVLRSFPGRYLHELFKIQHSKTLVWMQLRAGQTTQSENAPIIRKLLYLGVSLWSMKVEKLVSLSL